MNTVPEFANAAEAAFLTRLAGINGGHVLIAAYEDIRQAGIREARKAHDERLKLVRRYAENPGLFFARIRPSLSTQECIEDAKRYIFGFRNLPTWKQANRRGDLAKHIENRLLCRYFRRHGKRLWIAEAA